MMFLFYNREFVLVLFCVDFVRDLKWNYVKVNKKILIRLKNVIFYI